MKPFGWGRKEVPHDAPLLSVIIPAYKAEKFLDECLNSLRAQRLSDIEVVVVDDGSPDRSAQITKKHAKADPRIRLLTRPNGGSSAARMTGIERSRGRYITFVDADDIVTVDGFAAAVESLESSGSDWAPLPYRQFSNKGLSDPPGWIDHLFAAGRWLQQTASKRWSIRSLRRRCTGAHSGMRRDSHSGRGFCMKTKKSSRSLSRQPGPST